MSAFKALVQNSSDVISLVSPEGLVLFASTACESVLGYSPFELVGRQSIEFIHPEDLRSSQRTFQRVLARARNCRRIQTRVRHKHGHWCWMESTITNLLDEAQLMGVVVNCREISHRQIVSEARRQAES